MLKKLIKNNASLCLADYFKFLLLLCGLILWCDVTATNIKLTEISSESLTASENPKALFSMAVKYEHAEGVLQDKEKAIQLYCQAAKLNYADAQYALGWMYANGRSVSKDDNIAAQLFAMAAEQGHAHAQQMMRYISASAETVLPACLQSNTDDEEQGNEAVYPDSPIFNLVNELAPHYDVDPYLVMAVISAESAFDIQAVSPKNAQGLMQLIPATAARFQVKDSFDAEENIKGGMAYLRWLLAFFKGDVSLALAAYNAGEGAVEKYQGIPPYPETINYVKKIKARYRKSKHPYQPDIVSRHAFISLSANDDE